MESMKTCNKCKQTKPYTEYYPLKRNRDGYSYHCKSCDKLIHKAGFLKHKLKRMAVRKAYVQTDRYKALKLKYDQEAREKWPEKKKANNALTYAVTSGRITKKPCEICGEIKVQAHHNDGYEGENVLKVMWLCIPHHKEQHEKMKSILRL